MDRLAISLERRAIRDVGVGARQRIGELSMKNDELFAIVSTDGPGG